MADSVTIRPILSKLRSKMVKEGETWREKRKRELEARQRGKETKRQRGEREKREKTRFGCWAAAFEATSVQSGNIRGVRLRIQYDQFHGTIERIVIEE